MDREQRELQRAENARLIFESRKIFDKMFRDLEPQMKIDGIESSIPHAIKALQLWKRFSRLVVERVFNIIVREEWEICFKAIEPVQAEVCITIAVLTEVIKGHFIKRISGDPFVEINQRPGEELREYLVRCTKIIEVSEWSGLGRDEHQVKRLILRGLTDTAVRTMIVDAVMSNDVSLAKLMTKLADIAAITTTTSLPSASSAAVQAITSQQQSPPLGPGNRSTSIRCYKCDGKGHFARQCPTPDRYSDRSKAGSSGGGGSRGFRRGRPATASTRGRYYRRGREISAVMSSMNEENEGTEIDNDQMITSHYRHSGHPAQQ